MSVILDAEKKIRFNPGTAKRYWNSNNKTETLYETKTGRWVLRRSVMGSNEWEEITYECAVMWLIDNEYEEEPEINYSLLRDYTDI